MNHERVPDCLEVEGPTSSWLGKIQIAINIIRLGEKS